MREPDLHYEQTISLNIEPVTQNLSENLHLKWSYGLLFVDEYSNEQGSPMSVVSGIRREDDKTHYLRITLTSDQKVTQCKIDIWEVATSGWPFPNISMTPSTTDAREKLVDIVEDILEFTQTPYQKTGGVFPWLRNMFTGNLETRKYKD